MPEPPPEINPNDLPIPPLEPVLPPIQPAISPYPADPVIRPIAVEGQVIGERFVDRRTDRSTWFDEGED